MFPLFVRNFRRVRCGVALFFTAAAITAAQIPAASQPADNRPDSLFSTDYLESLWGDTTSILTSPARWDGSDWATAGLWTAATLGTATVDHTIRHDAQAHYRTHGEDQFFKQWEKLGAEYSFIEMAGFEIWGLSADNRNARDTAMDAVTATVIASGIITPVLKYSIGRYRPTQTSATFKFRPFSGHQSFPSGHATQAFAVATVVANHYTEPWEQALSYGAAALVGVARVQQNAHFASDVVAGSAIGWAVGRAVVHHHTTIAGYTVQPYIGDGAGLILTRNF